MSRKQNSRRNIARKKKIARRAPRRAAKRAKRIETWRVFFALQALRPSQLSFSATMRPGMNRMLTPPLERYSTIHEVSMRCYHPSSFDDHPEHLVVLHGFERNGVVEPAGATANLVKTMPVFLMLGPGRSTVVVENLFPHDVGLTMTLGYESEPKQHEIPFKRGRRIPLPPDRRCYFPGRSASL